MKKLIIILSILFILSKTFAGTNATVTINTNTGQMLDTWFSAGGPGVTLTNTNTAAGLSIPTNFHLHLKDEFGSTYDFRTNGTLDISNYNGNRVTISNGNVTANTFMGNSTAAFTGNGGGLTNLELNLLDEIICPYPNVQSALQNLNLPSTYTNSSRIFGPWLGSNYIQQAVNAMPYGTNYYQFSGGGRIWVVGVNWCTNTIMLTNASGATNASSACWDFEAPAFGLGAIVCTNAPCVLMKSTNSTGGFIANNVIFSCQYDLTNYIVLISNSVSHVRINDCMFAPWLFVTNNEIGSTPIGFTSPSGQSINAGNLVGLGLIADQSDEVIVRGNKFCALATGIYWNVDHGDCEYNFFTQCGGTNAGVTPPTPYWPYASLFSLGACIVCADVQNDNWTFYHNEFYEGAGYSYYIPLGAGPDHAVGMFDVYESDAQEPAVLFASGAHFAEINPWDNDDNTSADVTALAVSGPPYHITGTAPAGSLDTQFLDSTGFYVSGAGLASISTASPAHFYDASGKGLSFDGVGNATLGGKLTVANNSMISGNGNGLTNLNWPGLIGGVVGGSFTAGTTKYLPALGVIFGTQNNTFNTESNIQQTLIGTYTISSLNLTGFSAGLSAGSNTTFIFKTNGVNSPIGSVAGMTGITNTNSAITLTGTNLVDVSESAAGSGTVSSTFNWTIH